MSTDAENLISLINKGIFPSIKQNGNLGLTKLTFSLCDEREIKNQAYKEFAEKLKDKWFGEYYDSSNDVDFDEFIDNLLNEMMG